MAQAQLLQEDQALIYQAPAAEYALKYEMTPEGLKESILLDQPVTINTFSSEFSTTNLITKLSPENIPVFFDTEEKYQFHFERPFAQDASGNTTYAVRYLLVPKGEGGAPTTNPNDMRDDLYQKSAGKLISKELLTPIKELPIEVSNYELVIEVDPEWLFSAERTYPIMVDPTVVHDESSDFASGIFNKTKDFGSGIFPSISNNYLRLAADVNTVGLWHMDEGTVNTCAGGVNDACDASSNGNDGAFQSSTSFTTDSLIGSHAVNFSGGTDYIRVPSSSSLNPPSQITVEAWVKTTATGTNQTIVSKTTGCATSGYLLWLNQNGIGAGIPSFFITTGGWLNGTYAINDGQWHHVAGVFDGNMAYLYVDGNLVNRGARTGSLSSTTDLGIGGSVACGSSLNGTLDEVRISDTARTPDEIRTSASRTPSGMYTSDVIDLTSTGAYESLSWTTTGESPTDGETPTNTLNLITQYRFNDTSGTTATSNDGACGSSCDATLSGFASTTSQDQANGTGWTSLNRRWGAGAITFDGTDDIVTATHSIGISMSNRSAVTIAGWVKLNALPGSGGRARIFNTNVSGENVGASLAFFSNSGQLELSGRSQAADSLQTMTVTSPANPLEWHYYVGVLDYANDQMRLYVDGKLVKSQAASFGSLNYNKATPMYLDTLGGRHQASGYTDYLNGTLDAVSIYARALSEKEIQANYAVSSIEVQTRSSANGSSWEDWSTHGSEATINNMDTPYSPNLPGLVGYWAMDELVNDLCLGTKDVCDSTVNKYFSGGNITGSPSIVDGRIGKARNFSATPDAIHFSTTESAAARDLAQLTISAWIKPESAGESNAGRIIEKELASGSAGWDFYLNSSNQLVFNGFFTTSALARASSTALTLNQWNHVVVTWDGSTSASNVKMYINGQETGYSTTTNGSGTRNSDSSKNMIIGNNSVGRAFDGIIDEVMVFNRVLSSDEAADLANGPSNTWKSSNSSTLSVEPSESIRFENSGSTAISNRSYANDHNTAGYWKFEETGGTGAYLKDQSKYGNHATPNTTTVAPGINGNGRSIGASGLITTSKNGFSLGSQTIEMWVKPTWNGNDGVMHGLWQNSSNASANLANTVSIFKFTNDLLYFRVVSPGGTLQNCATTASSVFVAGKWVYIAATYSSADMKMYINGTLVCSTGAITVPNADVDATAKIGSAHSSDLGGGVIDEVKVSNVVRSADEIAEAYKMGRNDYANLSIESTNLSDDEGLPFYIAADQAGTYLTGTIGESHYANYQPDAGTVGLWHLDDNIISGVNIKDSTTYNHGGTASNVSSVNGKVGKATAFGGASNSNINLGNPPTLSITGSQTIEMWLYPTSFAVRRNPYNKAYGGEGTITLETNGTLNYYYGTAGADASPYSGINSAKALLLNQWSHIAIVRDLQNMQWHWYINGVRTNSGTAPYASATASSINATIGHGYAGSFVGSIDEVRISNVARTPDEIRQSFEIGSRTLPITIDFSATLDSGNLIANSTDTSFTVNGKNKGLPNKGSNLYVGETIIVKENYNGTEYVAQGVVASVTESTGAVTVSGWNAGSTFPSGGFTANATVLKWQKEFWRTKNSTLTDNISATTLLSLNFISGNQGRTVWLDDLKSTTGYLENSAMPTSTPNRYFQYRGLFNSSDPAHSASLTSATLTYHTIVTNLVDGFLHDKIKLKTTTPTIRFSATDPGSADVHYQVQWATDHAFTSPTAAASESDAGFTNVTNGGDTAPFTSGNTISYTWQTPLTNNTTYYYRVRAKVFGGGYGPWSVIKSMTIDTSLSNNGWFETQAAQFDTGTKDPDVLVSTTENHVYTQAPTSSTAFSKPITITNGGSTLTNHHTLLTVDTATLVSGGKLQSDCDDLRFFDQNQARIKYWIEGGCNTSTTAIWVEVPSLPNGDTIIKMAYGNATLAKGSEDYGGLLLSGFDGTCPAGWTAASTLNSGNYYIRGGTGAVGTTGGNATHTHPVSLTTGAPSTTEKAPNQDFDNDSASHAHHTHSWSGDTSSVANAPSYYNLVFCTYNGPHSAPISVDTTFMGLFSTTPSGWTRFSTLDNRFMRANATAGGTGGVATHTHTITGTFPAPPAKLSDNGDNNRQVAGSTSTHSLSTTTAAASSLPAYSSVIYAKPNSASALKDGQIAMFNSNSTPPLGWSRYTNLDNKMPLGSATAGTSGGSDTVSHTVAPFTTGNDATSVTINAGDDVSSAAETGHNHTTEATDTEEGNIVPPYYTTSFYQRKTDATTKSIGSETAASLGQFYISTPITASQITSAQWSKVIINDDVTNGSIKYYIYYDNTGTPTPIPSEDLPGNGDGFSSSPISLSAITTTQYPIIYLVAEFIYDSGSPALEDWEVVFNTPPNTPTLNEPATTTFISTLTPTLKTTSTDADGDTIQYKIELCTDSGMTTGCVTIDQTSSQTGWTGQNANGNTTYTSGTQASYTIQTPLAIDTTYYWRTYAIDPFGSNQFSSTQGTPYSFKTNHTPGVPTSLQAEGTTNPTGITNPTPEFSAIFDDPDTAETAVYYQIQVNDESDFTGNIIWDSEKTAMSPLTEGSRSALIEYAGTPLIIDGLTYYWRIKFWDDGGLDSPYSSIATFQMDSYDAPTPCYAVKDPSNTYINIFWKNVLDEDSYTIERSVDGGAFAALTTKTANVSSHQDTTVTLNRAYQYRIKSIDGVQESGWCTTTSLRTTTGGTHLEGLNLEGVGFD